MPISWFGRKQPASHEEEKARTEAQKLEKALAEALKQFGEDYPFTKRAKEVLGGHSTHGLIVLAQMDSMLTKALEKEAQTSKVTRVTEYTQGGREWFRTTVTMNVLNATAALNNTEHLHDLSRVLSELRDVTHYLMVLDPEKGIILCTKQTEGMAMIVGQVAQELGRIRQGVPPGGKMSGSLSRIFGHERAKIEKNTFHKNVDEERESISVKDEPPVKITVHRDENDCLVTDKGEPLALLLIRSMRMGHIMGLASR